MSRQRRQNTLMPVISLARRRRASPAGDDPSALAAEVALLRQSIVARRTEAERLGREWLSAPGRERAQIIKAQQTELLRTADRDEADLPVLEQNLARARARVLRSAVERHQATLRDAYFRLRDAIEAAAAAQGDVIKAREAAVAEIGESVAAIYLPHVAYRGFLVPDLIAMWRVEMDRLFAKRQPLPPDPEATKLPQDVPAPVAPSKDRMPPDPGSSRRRAEPPSLPPKPHPRRHDAPPGDGQVHIVVVRPGVDLDDGRGQCTTGDVVTVPAAQGRALVENGAAEYAKEVRETAHFETFAELRRGDGAGDA